VDGAYLNEANRCLKVVNSVYVVISLGEERLRIYGKAQVRELNK
jgi:hypothetical protein